MSRRAILFGSAIGAAAAAVAIGVVFVAGGGNEPKQADRTASGHDGMVTGTVWVANEGNASLTAIDAARNEVVTTLTGINGPHNLQVSPDGQNVWVVSGHDAMAVMIDGQQLALHGSVATGQEPAHVVVTPDGRTTYTSNGGDNTVTAIDVATMKKVASIAVGAFPHGMLVVQDGRNITPAERQNFKFVSWERVAEALQLD